MKTAIGLMSGTSMDGIDVALLRTDGRDAVAFGPTLVVEYTPETRRLLESANADAADIGERTARPGCLAQVEAEVTRLHARAVQMFLQAHDVAASDVDLLGFHGQTVLHRPDDALTVQLGDGAALARATGIDTVFDFRAADMEAGGQGAPLVPVFHRALAAKLDIEPPLAIVNIGGISNVTYIGADGELTAFDCGPGNALIDQWVQAVAGIPFDQGGAVASEGAVIASIAERYLAHPFLQRNGPKSLDRADFPALETGAAGLHDGARTLAHVTAAAIAGCAGLMPQPPKAWIICGGGRHNAALMGDLTALCGGTVLSGEGAGLDGDMLEAQAFAYLAVRSVAGLPLTFPGTTGCTAPAVGGRFAAAP